jgi:hypothetical protein
VERHAAAGKPVIDLINGITSPKITARGAVDYFHLARLTGEYVRRLSRGSTDQLKVA